MSGTQSSPIFLQKLAPLVRKPLLAFKRKLLSTGCIVYYLNSPEWQTRLYLHNYFRLLNDDTFHAEWEVLFYSQDGRLVERRQGVFAGAETAVIDLAQVFGLSPCGIVYVHIRDADPERYLPGTYPSIFFTEYYRPGTSQNVIMHGLAGAPRAAHYTYRIKSTSWVTPPGYRPHLLIANACDFQSLMHPVCGSASIDVTNHKNEKMTVALPPLKGRECQKVDLFALAPTLEAHLGHKPYGIEIYGKNFMSKPILFQTNGTRVLVEHS